MLEDALQTNLATRLQAELCKYGLQISGDSCSAIQDFFKDSETAKLFGKLVDFVIESGYVDSYRLDKIAAVTTRASSSDYRGVYIYNDCEDTQEISIVWHEKLCKILKTGTGIHASYGSLKYHKISVLLNILYGVGCNVADAQFDQVIKEVLPSCKEITKDEFVHRLYIPDISRRITHTVSSSSCKLTHHAIFSGGPRDNIFQANWPSGGRTLHMFCDEVPESKIVGICKPAAFELVYTGDRIHTDIEKWKGGQFEGVQIFTECGVNILNKESLIVTELS